MHEYQIKTNKNFKNEITQLIQTHICCQPITQIIWECAIDFYFIEDGHTTFLSEKLYLRLYAVKSCFDCLRICDMFMSSSKTIWNLIFTYDFEYQEITTSQQALHNFGSLKDGMKVIQNCNIFYFNGNLQQMSDTEDWIQGCHDTIIDDVKDDLIKYVPHNETQIELYVQHSSDETCEWFISAFIQGDKTFLCQVYL